ncbi:glutamate-gated chloride channel-like [Centruroides sculpturatus]|uniref:glutamate-gated chloride channel-like n=1 Tax=Centruroides sculpturatus TaxID=218467 RepID=UPI000C6D4392|nr:glutamate-gated chloride channel-like [Centruroides sculpturatus]XP_023223692.1 glutamate-gated chloride channel-like [Centruroides sculpturatus]
MDFHIHMYFKDYWKDDRLNLKCLQKDNGRPSILPLEIQKKIWTPDIFFENCISGKLFKITLPNIAMKILPDGYIYRYARYDLRISCPMDLHRYPLDLQVCSIRISLFSFPDDMVTLHWMEDAGGPSSFVKSKKSIVYDTEIILPQFKITKTTTEKEVSSWNTGNYTTLKAIFFFDRMITAHLINTYIPSTLIVALSWLSFWLDVGAVPARVTLGVTSLLTLATQIVQSRKNLPPVSYVNAMDVWLFVCLNMVFATLMEYAISYYMTNYAANKFENWFRSWKQKLMNVRIMDVKEKSRQGWVGTEKTNKKKVTNSNKETAKVSVKQVQVLDGICRKLFPITFFIFGIIYWIYFGLICEDNN